jgi:chromosome segregation ATPase
MPDHSDDLENRVERLEAEVVRLKDGLEVSRAGAAAARVLAGGVDRDMSEIRAEMRAHRQSLNALRETQVEMGRQLGTAREELRSEMRSEIGGLRSEVQQGFGMVHTGLAQITALIRGIEQRGQG